MTSMYGDPGGCDQSRGFDDGDTSYYGHDPYEPMEETSITLTAAEAEVIIKQADNLGPFANVPELDPWRSIAAKLRKAAE